MSHNDHRLTYGPTNRRANAAAIRQYMRMQEQRTVDMEREIGRAFLAGTLVEINFSNNDISKMLAVNEQIARACLSLTFHRIGKTDFRPDGTPGWTLFYVGGTLIASISPVQLPTSILHRADHL